MKRIMCSRAVMPIVIKNPGCSKQKSDEYFYRMLKERMDRENRLIRQKSIRKLICICFVILLVIGVCVFMALR